MSQLKVVLMPDNTMTVFVESGPSFAAASAAINKVYAALGQNGVTIVDNTAPEQHRHNDPTVALAHEYTHQ